MKRIWEITENFLKIGKNVTFKKIEKIEKFKKIWEILRIWKIEENF